MLPFAIYDVFSDRAYAGNQLAVVFDGQELTSAQMQAIALEFNFSETVFVLPAAAPGVDYLARIFTPAEELPFAGHPTIGAAIAAVESGRVAPGGGTVVQECAAGLIHVSVDGGTAKLTSTAISVGPELDPKTAAAAIGLDAAKVLGTPKNASAGLDHNFVRLADEDVAAAVDVPGHLEKVYLFSFDEDSHAVHARLFHRGVGEDPATGSAAVALGVHLVDQGLISGDGVHSYEIAQGAEIDRPSSLHGEVVVEHGAAVSVSVSGAAVKVAEGTLVTLPE
jgi:trans-2,3-dihydro-3-hydroxyanthranilate isomerase